MSTFESDAVYNFARECQIAAGTFLGTPQPSEVLESVHSILAVLPDCSAAVAAIVVARALSALARNIGSLGHRHVSSATALEHALCVLLNHYTDPATTLRGLACALNVTEAYLSALITGRTRHGFLEHLNALRIVQAVALISAIDEPVGHISAQCGYRQTSHLDRHFRDRLHTSPTRFRYFITGPQSIGVVEVVARVGSPTDVGSDAFIGSRRISQRNFR